MLPHSCRCQRTGRAILRSSISRASVSTVSASVCRGARAANACCFAPGNVGVDVVVAEREAREDVDVQEVVMPCERMEEQSETEGRTDGGRERGRDGYGCGVATAAAEDGVSSGGCTHRGFVREGEEVLAEGVRVRNEEFTPGATGEGVETARRNCPRCPEAGKPDVGSLGGSAEVGGGGGGCLVATASAGFPGSGGFWGRGRRAMVGRKDEALIPVKTGSEPG